VAVDDATSWTAATTLEEGANTIVVTSFDAAGNESSGVEVSVTLDTTAPAAPVLASLPSLTNQASLDVSGEREPGSEVLLGGDPLVPAGSDPTWSATITLVEGDNALSFTAKDPAGNVSLPTVLELVLDTQPPAAPTVTAPAS